MSAPEKRTYTRSELASMTQDQLTAIANDLSDAVREGRIVDDRAASPAPTGDGPVFTRSQISGMNQQELINRHDEIQKALQDNRVLFGQ